MHTDVIIIGGGISGLATALHCTSKGYRCVILERNSHLGGRIHTVFGKTWKYEAGAGRINHRHNRTIALLKQFGITLIKIDSKKEYRDIEHRTRTHKNPSTHLLTYVLKAATNIPKHTLQQMTLGGFCKQVMGHQKTQLLIQSFGYNAEFEDMNAWDGIQVFKRDFAQDSVYYTSKEGLTTWIDRIRSHLEQTGIVSILTGYEAYQWKRGPRGVIQVDAKCPKGKSYEMSCKALVCAIPKSDLLSSFHWSPEQISLLNSVDEVSLHRIYGQFPTQNQHSWFDSIPSTTTNNPIRQFIPISRENGLAMISYSDRDYADYWNEYGKDHGDSGLRNSLLQQLHVVFPEIPRIPKPLWVKSHYWNSGVHLWKPGFDSKKVSTELIQPFGKSTPFYVVGESYSMHQSWIEGALETVDEAIPRIHQYLTKKWYRCAF